MDRAGASRALSTHVCTTGLVSGIAIRDVQYAMRHADPRTTLRYDMAKANLGRHAAHAVAAYLAGREHRLTEVWRSRSTIASRR